ncbi:MAG: UDP-N-acetylmuramate--L-alanine ligase [Bdellovibrionaceae bacterium]|nr:UDP-N-acetylmuramate--L-alanine ligase [Pseudobdellovibrionaceae bacterium]
MKKLVGVKFHFVGIGGIGMCGLAELMKNLGAIVSGSDIKENQQTQYLQSMGIKIFIGHKAEQVGDVDVVVYSSAVKLVNPELLKALDNKIPVIPRAEALAEIMRLKRGVAIAGTHGKTTTTSLCASAFLATSCDPTIVVGGRLDVIKSTAKLGSGEWLIAEADESDGSFQKLSPEIVIITNIDDDHMDYYKNFENLQKAFYNFASSIPFYGSCIVCGDDPLTRKLFTEFPKRIFWYGFNSENDFIIKKESEGFSIQFQGQKFARVKPPIPGDHNALNATAALIAGHLAGLDLQSLVEGIESFGGVDRRFQYKGQYKGVKIYDDYGHHPTEIKAVLKAFREKFPKNRLNVIFQPHRYSRFQSCWQGFLEAFDNADQLYVVPVYRAGEDPLVGIDSENFCTELKHSNVHFFNDFASLQKNLRQNLKEGEILVTLGAGDVWKIGTELCHP